MSAEWPCEKCALKSNDIEALKKELALYRRFCAWLESGYGGMFGHQAVTPEQDAYERAPQALEALRNKLGLEMFHEFDE